MLYNKGHIMKNLYPSGFATVMTSLFMLLGLTTSANGENRIDTQRPDAPELAKYGQYNVGVRTLEFTNPNQIDVVNIDTAQLDSSGVNSSGSDAPTLPKYDRPLTVELWYPAAEDATGSKVQTTYLRDGKTKISLHGKAMRDASPAQSDQAHPFVIISHGYPGNRYLMSHLGENLASKGYVVASIDHTDSTYRTLNAFKSTLVNRPLDQGFVLNEIERLSETSDSFLHNIVDTQNTAIIGYSMGGYGAVIMSGAGMTKQAAESNNMVPSGLLSMYQQASTSQAKRPDSRIKTVIAFAPWGMNYNVWNEQGLADIDVPMLFVAGSVDDVSGYENGVRALWQNAKNTERALLTYENANHSAGAPMPAPEESFYYNEELGINVSVHYTDSVWESARMNNIAQHFTTAWLGKYLKKNAEMQDYLDLVPSSNEGRWAKDQSGKEQPEHTHWNGFKNRTAKGLKFEWLAPQK